MTLSALLQSFFLCFNSFYCNVTCKVPAALPVRLTGRELDAVMPERTIPTSVVFATLTRHLSSTEKYTEVVLEAQAIIKKIVNRVASASTPLVPIQLVVSNLTTFSFRTVELFDDGCFDGEALWGCGSVLSNNAKLLFQHASDPWGNSCFLSALPPF